MYVCGLCSEKQDDESRTNKFVTGKFWIYKMEKTDTVIQISARKILISAVQKFINFLTDFKHLISSILHQNKNTNRSQRINLSNAFNSEFFIRTRAQIDRRE